MSGNFGEWLTAFKQQLIVDKKKSAILGGLFVVLLVVVVRSFLPSSKPATVEAMPVVATPVAPRDPVEPRIRPSPEAVEPARQAPRHARADKMLAESPARSERLEAEPVASIDDMPQVLERDLFNIPSEAWSKFRPAGGYSHFEASRDSDAKEAESSIGFWQQFSVLMTEYQKARQRESDEMSEALARLQLQSTMTGSVPMAYISGHLVHEGDVIQGFSVVRIEDRRVTVRKSSVVRKLVMP
ncbi:MAG: hypothetical protein JXQ75_07120 [Phycisphaerae bacterium]|nr:hypothetical protein [Phycisphaerae bacterium]